MVGREEDKAILQDAVKAAESKWKDTFGHDAPKLTVAQDFLPSGSKDSEGQSGR